MVTLSERILGATAGEYIDRSVDLAYAHDGTGVLTQEAFLRMGGGCPRYPERIHIIFDHIVPANNSTTADLQQDLRRFARECNLHFHDGGEGICHQVMAEGQVAPGAIVVGADSHTCTLGALGAFATGVGATDMAGIWKRGGTWFRVPETTAVNLNGTWPDGVEAKDAALAVVSRLGQDGATYRALEFVGDGITHLDMAGRFTLCNMAVETGAKTGLCYADRTTIEYLTEFGRPVDPQTPDPDPGYAGEIYIDLGDLPPLVACPHRVDRVAEVTELAGTPIDQVFVGTCTNGRFEDLSSLASTLEGHKVKARTIVLPASRRELLRATAAGVTTTLLEAGCIIGPPGCGPCLGAHMGVIGKGEVCLSTANRNFRNRMGVGGEIYLSSVSTAAAGALTGEIRPPEGWK
ncbi:MAG: 3-isopropylmalate dehydratase large subunit [Methanoculleaceae archaeon]